MWLEIVLQKRESNSDIILKILLRHIFKKKVKWELPNLKSGKGGERVTDLEVEFSNFNLGIFRSENENQRVNTPGFVRLLAIKENIEI